MVEAVSIGFREAWMSGLRVLQDSKLEGGAVIQAGAQRKHLTSVGLPDLATKNTECPTHLI